MPIEELKNLLADVADDVKQVQVHKRAVAQSRRIATRRLITAGVMAAVLGGGSIAAAVTMSGNSTSVDQATDPTGTELIDGTFYQGADSQDESGLAIWRVGDAQPTEVYMEGEPMVAQTGAISPNGRYLSYLTSPAREDESGRIMLYDTAIQKETDLGAWSGDPDKVCSAPSWTPDGESLLVDYGRDRGAKRYAFIDVDSHKPDFLPVQPPGCDAKVAAVDGVDVVYTLAVDTDSQQTNLMRTNPDKVTTSPAGGLLGKAGKELRELTAVSPDGRFVCVATGKTAQLDEGLKRTGTCDTIVHEENGKSIGVPVDKGQTWQANAAVFSQPGRLLIICRDGKAGPGNWQLWTYDGVLLDEKRAVEPENIDALMWLGFVPN